MPITDPTDIAGLGLWFDGDDASSITISSGSSVSQWNDKSGNARHLTQGTAARQPQYTATLNGRDGLTFNTSQAYWMTVDFTPMTQPVTRFIVCQLNAGFGVTLHDSAAGFTSRMMFARYSNNNLVLYAGGGEPVVGTGDTNVHLWTTVYNDTASIHRAEGLLVGTTHSPGSQALDGITLAASIGGGADHVDGAIYEVIFYDALLTGAQISDVEAYLATKWGITLPAPPLISHVALGVKAGTGTTTVSVAHPAGTANHQVLLAGRCAWEPTVTFADESGWTASGSLSGGTGTATDAHQTAIRVDRKELSASDAGPTVFDQTVSAQGGVAAVMASYQKASTTATWGFATATGDDATHAANRSVTASSTMGLAVGDIVTAWVAVDTDASMTITSPAITATNVTFGATTRRTSGVGSGTGDDGNIELFDAEVTALSSGTEQTQAPVLDFTTATTQCGPVAFVRLRAVPANVNGTAAGSLAISGVAAGAPAGPGGGVGEAAGTVAFGATASGAVAHTATAAGTLAITGTAVVPSGGADHVHPVDVV